MRRQLAVAILSASGAAAHAESCPTPKDEIATDRPDVTNSSLVVPTGSLQVENGINVSGHDHSTSLDGTNTRLRLGVAPCLEVLVDVPTYFGTLRGRTPSGFTDVSPAIKWQISPVPGKVDLSLVAGLGLPTGSRGIAGEGVLPYAQAPWSLELGNGWGVNGMFTQFFQPADPVVTRITETTVSLEKKVGEKADVFVEYVGDYPNHAAATYMLNSGGSYRLTNTEQIDFHVAVGLNAAAPDYSVGLGYSWRRDRLF